MKQIFTILAVSGCLLASAQEAKKDTSYWKTSGFLVLILVIPNKVIGKEGFKTTLL